MEAPVVPAPEAAVSSALVGLFRATIVAIAAADKN